MKNLIVTEKYSGKKLDKFLLDSFKGLSLNTFYKALRKKDISINGKRTNKNEVLFVNDNISIYIKDEFLFPKFNLNIVYEDDNIVIVNKPIQIEVLSTNNQQKSLTNMLLEHYNSSEFPSPCHRLDTNTCGLVLFAKNKTALDILFNKFKNREIEKYYKCTVYGIPQKKEDTLKSYLFKDSSKSTVYISDIYKKGYQKIITSYKILSKDIQNNTCILEVNLHTGKTHQIRAHLAHIGYPIIGDGKYGRNDINKKFNINKQMLCAYKIAFNFSSESGILEYLNQKTITI